MGVSPPTRAAELARGVGRVHRTGRASWTVRQRREEAADEIGVVGQERPQLFDGQRNVTAEPLVVFVSGIASPAIASTNPSAAGASTVDEAAPRARRVVTRPSSRM